MAFISIGLDVPGALSRISKGGLQWSSEALEANMKLAGDKIKAVYTQSIREVAKETRSLAIRELNAKVHCERRQIEKRVTVERVTENRARGTVRILGRRIDLRYFNPTQTKKGVLVRTGERTKIYKRAFGPNIRRLGGNVFVRQGKTRTPIRKIPGVSLVSVADRTGLTERLRIFMRSEVRKRIKQRMRLLDIFGSSERTKTY